MNTRKHGQPVDDLDNLTNGGTEYWVVYYGKSGDGYEYEVLSRHTNQGEAYDEKDFREELEKGMGTCGVVKVEEAK